MYYCNPCGTKNRWPTDALMRSKGRCEVCGVTANCNDIKSSELPLPAGNDNEGPDGFTTSMPTFGGEDSGCSDMPTIGGGDSGCSTMPIL